MNASRHKITETMQALMAESAGSMTHEKTDNCCPPLGGYGLQLFIDNTETVTPTAEKDTLEPEMVLGRLSWEEFQ